MQGRAGGGRPRLLQRRVFPASRALQALSRAHGRPSTSASWRQALKEGLSGCHSMTPAVGRRGSRSGVLPVRPHTVAAPTPSPAVAAVLRVAVRPHPRRNWIGPAVGLAVGVLVGRLVPGALQHQGGGIGVEGVVLVAAGVVVAARVLLRGRAKPPLRAPAAPVPVVRDPAPPETDLDRGVRDIRRTDRGFDAARFAGYAGMMFRDVQSARMARDVAVLRDRLTPAMHVELEARCNRLRTNGQRVSFAGVDVSPEVTEAWQDSEQDYVTAYLAGSMLSHTIDGTTGKVVKGSPTIPTPVEAFLTFTRPAGLNFWRLSIIQDECPRLRP